MGEKPPSMRPFSRLPPLLVAALAVLAALSMVAACKRPHDAREVTDAASAAGSTSAGDADAGGAPAALPPLAGDWAETLALEGGAEANITKPLGATSPRPVIVGVHGAGDRADWSCSEWSAVAGGSAFVVCPHGSPDARWKGTLVWGSPAAIAKQSARAVEKLKERYGSYVAAGPMIYGAWSHGATLAGPAVEASGGAFGAVVLVEIGHTPVDARATARSFVKAGVRRVVVSCSSLPCRAFAADFRKAAAAVDLPLHVTDVGLRGHWFDDPVIRVLSAELPWLTDGDPRWPTKAPPAAMPAVTSSAAPH